MKEYIEWLAMCFIGEPGGYGVGINRRVFYSNVGAPIAFRILQDTEKPIGGRDRKSAKNVRAY